ncbi:MAG: CheY-like chemotaxis protein [Myxococcota bacterium]|jgi:CheY-like chemotaxis protein
MYTACQRTAIVARVARLLIVDDDADLRLLVRTLLERAQHKVDEASDPKEAVDKLAMRDYDAILMDIEMPRMSGLEFIRLLKDNPRFLHYQDTPIIVVSGNTDPGIMAESFEAGAVYHLQKPFTPAELMDTVRVVLHARG